MHQDRNRYMEVEEDLRSVQEALEVTVVQDQKKKALTVEIHYLHYLWTVVEHFPLLNHLVVKLYHLDYNKQ